MRIDVIRELVRKELNLYFSSPIGYLFIAAFLAVILFVFFWVEAFFARDIADVRPMFEWLPILLILLASALTMRTWSDERRTGTLEFLITLPASATELVVGKFIGCAVLLLLALGLTLPLPLTVTILGDLDWGPVVAGYLAAFLLGCTYIAIGVWISSRTENQIVALMCTIALSGVFYLLGSPVLTNLFEGDTSEFLRAVGFGSRFESITRGVLDFRDLYFYISVAGAFLILNVLSLHQLGWITEKRTMAHRRSQIWSGLVITNLLVFNFILAHVGFLRIDVTQGSLYSISKTTKTQLSQLTEPLLIRGYFSAKTHPLLAPLSPQLIDLLHEYGEIEDRVIVEIVDPIQNPDLEDEANSKYGIRPVPFQVSDRYQKELFSSYFDILIQYGDEYQVLGFADLIEVNSVDETNIDVQLLNPEYQLTRAIKNVASSYRGGGTTFEFIHEPVEFIGYISKGDMLPEELQAARVIVEEALAELESEADGKFSWQIHDPDADDGAVADEIASKYGFGPMAASIFDRNTFYFYMTFRQGETLVQAPLPDAYNREGFDRMFEQAMERFSVGLLKTVAISTPLPPPQNPYQQTPTPPGGQYGRLRDYLIGEFDIETTYLHGEVSSAADLLLVVEPVNLNDEQLFHLDQFLMKGGTVIIAASSFQTTLTSSLLSATRINTGLEDWLNHHGVVIEEAMVLDSQNAHLALPVTREVRPGVTFQEIHMFDYPFFPDVRSNGYLSDTIITQGLDQVTFAWSSPIRVDEDKNVDRSVQRLLETSDRSWLDWNPDIHPRLSETASPYLPSGEYAPQLLGVILEGQFTSFFDESPVLLEAIEAAAAEEEAESEETDDIDVEGVDVAVEEDNLGVVSSVIAQSPPSGRLVVLGSSQFVSDQAVSLLSSASGTLYSNSLQFMTNVVDYSVADESLLSIRGHGVFDRTLPPMGEMEQQIYEIANYAIAGIGLLALFLITHRLRLRRAASYRRMIGVGE